MAEAHEAARRASAGIERQRKLPNVEAIKIAWRSIRIRFWRSLITTAGIVLAIAFLSYVSLLCKCVCDP